MIGSLDGENCGGNRDHHNIINLLVDKTIIIIIITLPLGPSALAGRGINPFCRKLNGLWKEKNICHLFVIVSVQPWKEQMWGWDGEQFSDVEQNGIGDMWACKKQRVRNGCQGRRFGSLSYSGLEYSPMHFSKKFVCFSLKADHLQPLKQVANVVVSATVKIK